RHPQFNYPKLDPVPEQMKGGQGGLEGKEGNN
ncbi:unnamed protein product, partial [marine sediment metagenome]